MSTWHVAIDSKRVVLSVHPERQLSAAQESARHIRAVTCAPTRVEQFKGRSRPVVGAPLPMPKAPKGWKEIPNSITSSDYVMKATAHGRHYMCRHCQKKPLTAGSSFTNHRADCHLHLVNLAKECS